MLFMTPMKPANNLASSRAASFFSVFFLLLFSTPEAAILPRSARLTPGTRRAGRGVALSRHAAACVHQTTEAGEWLAVPPCLRTRRRQRSHCGRTRPDDALRRSLEGDVVAGLRLQQNRSPEEEPAHLARGSGAAKEDWGRGLRVRAARRSERLQARCRTSIPCAGCLRFQLV